MKTNIFFDDVANKWYRICPICKNKTYHKTKKSCRVCNNEHRSCIKCLPSITKCSVCGNHGHSKRFHNPPPTERKCNTCGKTLSISKFFHQKHRGSGKIYYATDCKVCNGKRLKNRYNQVEGRIQCLFNSIRKRSEKDNLPYNVTPKSLLEQYNKQNGKCYFTHQSFILENRGKRTISIDKLIPEKGYIDGNVVFCLFIVNQMKSNTEYTEFIELCKQIYDNRKQ